MPKLLSRLSLKLNIIVLFFLVTLFSCGGTPDGDESADSAKPQEHNEVQFKVVTAPTDLVIFVGYSAKLPSTVGGYIINKPIKVSSLEDYVDIFGGEAGWDGPFYLYHSMKLFFANGGKTSYVYSVGTYFDVVEPSAMRAPFSDSGVLKEIEGIALVAIPDAIKLAPTDTYAIYRDVLEYCSAQQNCFALLDLHQADTEQELNSIVDKFRQEIGQGRNLNFGAAYTPWVTLKGGPTMPSVGAIAGLFVSNDKQRGVWTSAANLAVAGIEQVSVSVSDQQNADLNAPADGKSISVLRSFPNRGILLWGARTLNDNSQDWRYSNVVRTHMMLDISIKNMLAELADESNNNATWTKTKSAIETWLNELWRQGALAGETAATSYTVNVGLNETMTQQDVIDGKLIVSVKVALVRPNEFIQTTFVQQVNGSSN